MSEEKIAFRPVKCTEQKLKTLNPINGYVYFTTDTGKIFLGQDGKLQLFGESNSFFYGQKNIEYDNTGVAPDPNVNFYLEEIETEILPEKNDLILNIDGCFYRVIDILDESTVKTTRLTLQGTGVGGGTGGGGDLGAPSFILNIPSGTVKYFSSESKKATIDFMGRSSDSENLITSVECSYDKNFTSNFYSEFNLKLKMEIAHEVDLTKYLNTFSSTGTKIYLRVTDSWGTVRSTSYTVYLANLQITSNMDELFGVLEDSFDYSCKIGGS